jgi:NTP pyrophosphatase (non-canonical NTP hydrolase)
MKRILIAILFLAAQFSTYAQDHVPEEEDYQNFMKSKTLVLLEKNPMSDFNMAIRKVMKNSWTLTDYQFINDAEFEAYRNNSSYSFLMITKASFARDRTKARYNFLSLLMAERATKVRNMPDLCSLPLAYEQVEDDSYSYKIEAFIRFMQNHVQLMLNDPSLISKNPFKYYNKKKKDDLENKVLYLTKEELAKEIDTEAEIRDIYPHKFKIVSREDVAQAIADKLEDVVFLHKVGPEKTRIRARVYKMLVGAGDPNFYYFDYEMMKKAQDDAFQEKDLKKIR